MDFGFPEVKPLRGVAASAILEGGALIVPKDGFPQFFLRVKNRLDKMLKLHH